MYRQCLKYFVFIVVAACATSGGSTGPTTGGGGNTGGATGNNSGPQGGECCFLLTECESGTEIQGPSYCPAGVTCFIQHQYCGSCVGEIWCAPYDSTPDASSDASSDGSQDAS